MIPPSGLSFLSLNPLPVAIQHSSFQRDTQYGLILPIPPSRRGPTPPNQNNNISASPSSPLPPPPPPPAKSTPAPGWAPAFALNTPLETGSAGAGSRIEGGVGSLTNDWSSSESRCRGLAGALGERNKYTFSSDVGNSNEAVVLEGERSGFPFLEFPLPFFSSQQS